MRKLQKFIDDQNQWGSFFNTAPINFPLSQTQVNDLGKSIDCKLSRQRTYIKTESATTKKRSALATTSTMYWTS